MIKIFGAVGAAVLALTTLSSCGTNPATGEQMLTFGTTIEDEAKEGAQEHPKIIKEFGGVYDDPNVTGYIAIVASHLAAASELPNIEWHFTVLDSDEVNAFALPGGYVYITRGLLALAANEAEIAGVLGHEIGHVNARHGTQAQSQATLAGLGAAVLGLALGSSAGDLAGQVGQGYIMHHSQAQEYQADLLGVRYLGRTGYDVRAMASFLDKLHNYSALENKIAGRPPGAVDEMDFFASHPRTVDRVEQATAEASKTSGSGTTLNRDAFLQHINGLLFGSSPAQGMVRGREFIHPGLGFRFEAPAGFRMINNPQAVLGIGPNNAMFQFDADTKPTNANPADYISRVWQPKVLLKDMERINVNGLDAATAVGHGTTKSGQVDVRFIAIKDQRNRVFRFLMATPPEQTQTLSTALQRLTYSFRILTPDEARSVKPLRIVLHTVASGETVQSLSTHMATSEYNEDWFRLLNGLQPGQPVQTGQVVKMVAVSN